jgi:hypothetical protein
VLPSGRPGEVALLRECHQVSELPKIHKR